MRAILEDFNSNLVLHELAVDFFLDKEKQKILCGVRKFLRVFQLKAFLSTVFSAWI